MSNYNQPSPDWNTNNNDTFFGDRFDKEAERRRYSKIVDISGQGGPSGYTANAQTHPPGAAANHPNTDYEYSHDDSHYHHDEHSQYASDSDGIQIWTNDLTDSETSAKKSRLPKAIAVCATLLVVVALGITIIHSSQPQMTPRDIVKLESYQGLQTPQAIFNLADLTGCGDPSDCVKKSRAATKKDIDNLSRSRDVPQQVAASNNADTVTTRTTQTSSLQSSDEQITTVAKITTNDSLPPVMIVQQQWSNIRSTPDIDGNIITSLDIGVAVEVIARVGDWFEVKALNPAAPRGYMHKSTINTSP